MYWIGLSMYCNYVALVESLWNPNVFIALIQKQYFFDR